MAYTVTISNRDNVRYQVDGKRSLLDSLRDRAVDLPYGCKYGGCITCAVESHDKLYRNPFLDPLKPYELKADIAAPKEA